MKEELIKFETAKLAKEKGFDWFVYDMYRNNDSKKKYRISFKPRNVNGDKQQMISAPTQSLLQKWLREEHNIKVDVSSSSHNMNKKWVDWYCSVNNIVIIDHRDGLETYEEALEKGLLKALNLIK